MRTEDRPLEEQYFIWLCSLVESSRVKNSTRTHWILLRRLFTKEFHWSVPHDDNRSMDGMELRQEFIQLVDADPIDEYWFELTCSCLEMFIALSRRLAFIGGGEARVWFWHILDNLEIISSDHDSQPGEEVELVLDTFIQRKFDYNGKGGLFPLKHPREDQRNVEIWYQLSAYLIERMD